MIVPASIDPGLPGAGRTQFALVLHDDPITHYRILQHGAEIMRIEYGATLTGVERLVVGDAWFVLRDDKVAEAYARGSSFLRRFVARIPFTRSISLHDATGLVVARVRRAFHLSPTRDCLLLVDAAGCGQARVAYRTSLGSTLDVVTGGAAVGTVEFRSWRKQVHMDVPFPAPVAALVAYAVHRCFGRDPRHEASTG